MSLIKAKEYKSETLVLQSNTSNISDTMQHQMLNFAYTIRTLGKNVRKKGH